MASNFPDNSLDSFESSLKQIEELLKKEPENKKWKYELSKCHTAIGIFYFSKGSVKEGANSFLTSLNILEQLSKIEPDNTECQIELYRTYEMLGDFLQSKNDLSYAELFLFQSLTIRKKVQGERHPEYVASLNKLASLYKTMGKFSFAETLLKQLLDAFNEMPGKEPLEYAVSLDLLADIYTAMGKYDDSIFYITKVASIKKKIFGEEHPEYTAVQYKLNNLYKNIGRLNSTYGNMQNAMKGNPALTKMEDMLWEADSMPASWPKKSETVNFAVSFPPCMIMAESYILDVWLFQEEQRNILLNRIKEENSEETKMKSEGNVIIERGTVVTARLTIENFIIEPAERTLTWSGELNNTSFIVRVPENCREGSKIGQVYFYINGLEVSRLHFKVLISSMQKDEKKQKNDFASGTKYKTAFASYASDDRNDVLARVQGLEKAGIEVFLDVRNLRSGERYEEKLLEKIRVADVFYLFWSSAAKKSEWVRKEWEYALSKRGIDFINPIPLESPEIAPPPDELSQVLHFGDWTLAYKRSKPVNQQ